jgi:hypothetical protein
MRFVVWYILKLIHKIEQAPINYLPRFLSSPPSIKAWAQSLAFQLHTPKHTEQDLENLLHTYLDQHLMALLRRTETRVMFLAAIVVMAMVFTAPCAQAINGGTYALLLCFYEHNIYPLYMDTIISSIKCLISRTFVQFACICRDALSSRAAPSASPRATPTLSSTAGRRARARHRTSAAALTLLPLKKLID